MPTIASGSSQTFTAGVRDALFSVVTNAGTYATVTGADNVSLGPAPARRSFGPYAVGQSITVAAINGDVIVEYGDASPQEWGSSNSVLSGSQVSAGSTGIAGVSTADVFGVDGTPIVKATAATAQPYRAAFWGDSRYNAFSAATVAITGSGTSLTAYRTPTWAVAFLRDVEFAQSYAVSGDTASAWQSASRTNGKTFAALATSDIDVVFVQYGVNDAIAGTASATIVGYLQQLVIELLRTGKLVVFESIHPVNSPVASAATVQATIDAVNAAMSAWLAQYSTRAVYVDTATALKAGGTLASYTYMDSADGLHMTRAGAYLSGKLLAAGARAILPRKVALFYGPDAPAPNICNQGGSFPIATQFNSANQGTATVVQGYGQDSLGVYYEWTITPLTFGTTFQEQVLQVSANFQTSAPPFYSLAGNEVLQGGARVVIDDGQGGAPRIYNVAVRQRFFTGSIFADWGITGAPGTRDSDHTEKIDLQVLTPTLSNTTASAVASPANATGYVLNVTCDSQVIGATYRVRVYNPQLRRVGYTSAAVSSTTGVSPATITNSTNGIQQVFLSGGTVSSITFNGTSTGLTSGSFMLDPGDSLVVTHTVAPTQVIKQLLTQTTLRGVI